MVNKRYITTTKQKLKKERAKSNNKNIIVIDAGKPNPAVL